MIGVGRVDKNTRREAVGIRRGRVIDTCPYDGARRGVGIRRHEDTAGARRGPERASVARRALDDRDKTTTAIGTVNRSVTAICQVGGCRRPDPYEIPARRFGCRGRELGAVRFEKVARTSPILRAPDAVRPLENCAAVCRMRVGRDRRIEVRSLRTRNDRSRRKYFSRCERKYGNGSPCHTPP